MTFLLMAAISAMTADEKPLVCAVMPDNSVNNKAAGVEYAGVKYTFCCGMCPGSFKKNPSQYVKAAADSDTVVGTSLFDAVTGARIDLKKAKFSSDYKGTRFWFNTADEKATFDKSPAKYGVAPAKEALVCAVSGEAIADYGTSAGYVDYEGVRYYACCEGCLPSLKKDIATLKSSDKVKVTEPKVIMGHNNTPHKHDGQ